MDRGHIERLFDPGGVIQQPVVGGVGNHRMYRPPGSARGIDLLLNAVAGEFPFRYTAQNTQRVTRRFQPQWNDIAHHQQVRQ